MRSVFIGTPALMYAEPSIRGNSALHQPRRGRAGIPANVVSLVPTLAASHYETDAMHAPLPRIISSSPVR